MPFQYMYCEMIEEDSYIFMFFGLFFFLNKFSGEGLMACPTIDTSFHMSNSPQMGTTPNSKVTLPNLHENAQTNASLYK